jgi:two-component system LytT family response regulator
MRVLIADDEPVAREVLREHAASIPALEIVGEARTGPETVERILELRPDLVLLDQHMPQLDGLGVLRSLGGGRPPLVIFVTAHERHALEAFEVGAVDYLLKPVRRERLEQAVEKARLQWTGAGGAPPRQESPRKIVGHKGSDMYLLDPEKVIAFQAEGELVHVITASETYLAGHSLKELEAKLEKPRFRRIHRSTIVNTDHVRRLSPLSSKRWLLKMSNGWEAIVSKRMAVMVRGL